MRIIAGTAKGARLKAVAGDGTRPTTDRVRESLFSTLENLMDFSESTVFDAYAGSGAIACEAISRGATHAICIDRSRKAAAIAQENLNTVARMGCSFTSAVKTQQVERFVRNVEPVVCDFVYVDPPYEMLATEVAELVANLDEFDWLDANSVVVIERSSRDPEWTWPGNLTNIQAREYGETKLWYGQRA